MDSQTQNITSSPSSVLFARGVIARLSIWPTLRLAVQEGWGGPGAIEKRRWLASVILDAFEEQIPVPDDQYIEEMLLQIMADEFETVLEDESAEIVATDIVRLWDESRLGKQDLMLKFEDLADKVKGTRMDAHVEAADDENEWDSDDEDGESEDEEEVPPLVDHGEARTKNEPEVDEDGFTLVKGKGKTRG